MSKRATLVRPIYTSLMAPTSGLKTIIVTKLFGSLRHRVPMAIGGPTVLTGGNGTGKSTILRLIDAVSRGDIEALVRAPIGGLELQFHSMPSLLHESHRSAKSLVARA